MITIFGLYKEFNSVVQSGEKYVTSLCHVIGKLFLCDYSLPVVFMLRTEPVNHKISHNSEGQLLSTC